MNDLEGLLTKRYINHLDSIINSYKTAERTGFNDEDISLSTANEIVVRIKHTVEQICGRNSQYFEQLELIFDEDVPHSSYYTTQASLAIGVVKALRNELADGPLTSIIGLIQGEIFTSYLEMAEHLLEEGYKDAAAVITGSTLENHLRKLCNIYQIDIKNLSGKPIKASDLNIKLRKKLVYGLHEQQMVTSWLVIRNDAAHGHFENYSSTQVKQFIDWLKDFIDRYSH